MVLPDNEDSDHISYKSEMEADDKLISIYDIVEGGPIDGIQCGEKMWILFDVKTPPYYDIQFKVFGKYFSLYNVLLLCGTNYFRQITF